MRDKLTEKQRSVLEFIVRYTAQHGYPPAIREIGSALGIKSLRGVTVHLDALERKGYISRESTSRSIRVLKYPAAIEAEDFQALPILGAIAAGVPLLAVENIEGELAVPKSMLGGADRAFLLRVKGDSMVGAHIMHGDLVVVKPQETAQSGDLVAVLLGDEATVKQFRAEAGGAVLMPANPAYEPIPIRDRDVRLIGKVIGLLRAY